MTFRNNFCRLLILSILASTYLAQVTISSKKTIAVRDYCGLTTPYQFQLSADQYQDNDQIQKSTLDMFPIDGDELIREFLNDGIAGFSRVMGKDPNVSALNYGILLAGLGLALIMAPILICCCCCPENCPPLTCRDPHKQYKNCELCWPNICIIVFSCAITGLCSYILVESRNFDSYYEDFRCSMSLVSNNFLYGTKNGQGQGFFTGLNTIKDEIQNLNDQLPQFKKYIQDLTNQSRIFQQFYEKGQDLLSQIEEIPNGINDQQMVLNYPTPFLSEIPNSSIPSVFPIILGNKQNNSTLIGKWYLGTKQLMSQLDNITNSSLILLNNYPSQSEFRNSSKMNDIVREIKSVDFKITKTFQILDSGLLKFILIGSYVILGSTIFFSFTLLFGACGLFCYKYSCRNIIYCSCFVLWILCIIHFLFALFFSFSTPLIYYGCIYITEGFDDPQLFRNNLQPIFDNSTTGNIISQCLTPNNGDALLRQFLDEQLYLSLSSLKVISDQITNFNPTIPLSDHRQSYDRVLETVIMYQNSQILDFESDSQLSELIKISQSSQYPSCSSQIFKSDSWIPNINQSPFYVACQVDGPNATLAECPNYQFVNSFDNCKGCMESSSIMSQYSVRQDVVKTINSRYSECQIFAEQFGNLWQNFYKVKRDSISNVLNRVNSTQSSVSELENYFATDVKEYLQIQQNKLRTDFGPIMDPQTGILAGLDCTVIRDDINVAMEIFCVNGLQTSYYLRFLFAAIAFALLVLICCGICSGKRHYMQEKFEDESKQSMAKKKAQQDVQLMQRQVSQKRFMRYY